LRLNTRETVAGDTSAVLATLYMLVIETFSFFMKLFQEYMKPKNMQVFSVGFFTDISGPGASLRFPAA